MQGRGKCKKQLRTEYFFCYTDFIGKYDNLQEEEFFNRGFYEV